VASDKADITSTCPDCLKQVRVVPYRAGDLPKPPVHIETGKAEC